MDSLHDICSPLNSFLGLENENGFLVSCQCLFLFFLGVWEICSLKTQSCFFDLNRIWQGMNSVSVQRPVVVHMQIQIQTNLQCATRTVITFPAR